MRQQRRVILISKGENVANEDFWEELTFIIFKGPIQKHNSKTATRRASPNNERQAAERVIDSYIYS